MRKVLPQSFTDISKVLTGFLIAICVITFVSSAIFNKHDDERGDTPQLQMDQLSTDTFMSKNFTMKSPSCTAVPEYYLPGLLPQKTLQPLRVVLGIITSGSKPSGAERVADMHRTWLQEAKWPWYAVLATDSGSNIKNFTNMAMPYVATPRVIHDRFYDETQGKKSMEYQEAMYRTQLFLEYALLCFPAFEWIVLIDDDGFVQIPNIERIVEKKRQVRDFVRRMLAAASKLGSQNTASYILDTIRGGC